ncbi:MAG: glycosyltransferase [Planctomycetes bacterium]|nr:glycosyltransferase [Planctomycetota bacterium]
MPQTTIKLTTLNKEQLRIGVVIPAHNELSNIAACITSCVQFTVPGDVIIVVDAASTDATFKKAQEAGAQVIRQPQHHRGYAVAAGVNAITNKVDVILIVHADMQLAIDTRDAIAKSLIENPQAIGGVLGHKIDDSRSKFRLVEFGNRFRAKYGQLPYGDQAMFVRIKTIDEIGGFPQLPIMEDLELALRCRNLGKWIYLDKPVKIDARHWRRGVVHTTLRNWSLAITYRIKRKEPAPSIQTS